jgi:chitin disaccharide deacetylase
LCGQLERPHFRDCYTENVRRLIVNADDLGMTIGINRAIVEGFEQGIITSATLMATSGAFDDAVARVHELQDPNRRLSVGCHIVLLDGKPSLPPERVSTLLEPTANGVSGQLRSSLVNFTRSSLTGKLNPEEIEAEAVAQFGRIQATGLELSHFDCHKHAHMFPAVLRPLLRAAKARGIRAVRNPFGRLFPSPLGRFLRNPKMWNRFAEMSVLRNFAARFRHEVQKQGLRTPDGSVGVLITGEVDQNYFKSIAENLSEGTWEFVCHPGYNDAGLDQVHTRLRQSRQRELEVLTSPEAKAALQRRGVELISYNEL